jgi:two-component system response regulator HydG
MSEHALVPARSLKVLVIGDSARARDVLRGNLADRGHICCSQNSSAAALDLAAAESFDVVVVDASSATHSDPRAALTEPTSVEPDLEGQEAGLRLCQQVAKSLCGVPIILVTNHSNLATAVAAVRAGASDLLSGWAGPEALTRAVERTASRYTPARSQLASREAPRFADLVGNSPSVRELVSLLARVSDLDGPVLLSGEVGSGKAQLARALHRSSKRGDKPFVVLNCAGGDEARLEAELFGHPKDARSGTERTGLLSRATHGTLFLDEISELPLRLQSKLLACLREQRFTSQGSDESAPLNVRIIASTRRNLEMEVQQERFRAELYYWVSTLHVPVPALRERGTDVLLYAQQFVERFAQSSGKSLVDLSQQAAERLLCYDWPGNLSELRNCVERAASLTERDQIDVEDLPDRVRNYRQSHVRVTAGAEPFEPTTLEEVERKHVLRVLENTGGNKTLAAQILGVDRRTLHRKCERYTG